MIYGFSVMSINMPREYFEHLDKLILKCLWKGKSSRRVKKLLRKNKEGESEDIRILRFVIKV